MKSKDKMQKPWRFVWLRRENLMNKKHLKMPVKELNKSVENNNWPSSKLKKQNKLPLRKRNRSKSRKRNVKKS